MNPDSRKNKERILRLADVKARTGLSRSTIYLNVSNGTFPRHISLGIPRYILPRSTVAQRLSKPSSIKAQI
ncbi:MAG: AlpA family phage regulatory protein [Proteobacteria bacterium]|nr:AlpA family phage regulatory protein [Pseudomonadota bacterium]